LKDELYQMGCVFWPTDLIYTKNQRKNDRNTFGSLVCLFSTTHFSLLRLIVRSGLDVQTFATRHPHACHHTRAPSGGRCNCGREMSDNFA